MNDATQTSVVGQESHAVHLVTDQTFEVEVLQSALPVFVDFWAPWCGPCRMVAPIVEELAGEYAGRIKFAKVDTDQNPGIAGALGIQSIPTLALFHGNKVLDYRIGVVPRDEFRRMFDGALAGLADSATQA